MLPWEAVEGISKAFMFGADKYGRYNYLGGMEWCRIAGGILRHVYKWLAGEDLDPESGLPHLDHAGAGVCMLIVYTKRGLGKDNRYKK